MVVYIAASEITSYLDVNQEDAAFLFNKIASVKPCIFENGLCKIKLSDLFMMQHSLLSSQNQNVMFDGEIGNRIRESGIDSYRAVSMIFSQRITSRDLTNGLYYCKECGSKRFERGCKTCSLHYGLPINAERIQIIKECEYPMMSLGYLIEIQKVITDEFNRLAKVKMDGYNNPSLVYLRNIRIIE